MKSRTVVLQALQLYFDEDTFIPNSLKILHRGRYANAIIYHYRDENHDLSIKDFSNSPPVIRLTLGRLFIRREEKILNRLRGIRGIVPYTCRLGKYTLAYPYIEGESLKSLRKNRERLPETFFHELERLVAHMHQSGVVHLDLRNPGNILYSTDGSPYLIDFQSALRSTLLPRCLHRLLRCADLSGVYKNWSQLSETPLPPQKQRLLTSFNRIRRFWVLRGYPLSQRRRR